MDGGGDIADRRHVLRAALPNSVNDYLTPFMNRMGVVFVVSLVLAVLVSLPTVPRDAADTIDTHGVRYRTGAGLNVGALCVVLILIPLYAAWW